MHSASHDMKTTIRDGVTGVVASLASVGISLADVEQWIRIASLIVGLLIGLLTLYKIVARWKLPPPPPEI